MEKTFVEKFVTLLLDRLRLSIPQKQELLKLQTGPLDAVERFLVSQKLLDGEELTRLKAVAWQVPYINLANRPVDEKAFSLVPLDVTENYKIICFERKDTTIHVGMLHPENYQAVEALDFLGRKLGVEVEIHIISPGSFERALGQYKTLGSEVQDVMGVSEESLEATFNPTAKKTDELDTIVREAPITKIISVIIKHAVEAKASDIHIEPVHKKTRVRYRVDGMLRTALLLPRYILPALITRVKVLANLKLDETRVPQDGRMRISVGTREVDFRVSTLPLFENEKVVLRILETSAAVPTLQELGFNSSFIRIIEENLRKPHGIFLATGPTGSGKSTTLYSILNILNKEGVNIVTLEDPIEFYIDGVNQSQVKSEVNYDFASGLRSILRQDPNIIMVGEIRDTETAKMAINAGLTGHLLFSTIHTNNALGVVPRLIDMGVEPFLIASTLNLVIAQRLTRKICAACKQKQDVPKDLKISIQKEMDTLPKELQETYHEQLKGMVLYTSPGCGACQNSGYQGRVAIAEVLEMTPTFQQIIYNGYDLAKVRDELTSQGAVTLKQDGILRVLEGVTNIEEVLRVTQE